MTDANAGTEVPAQAQTQRPATAPAPGRGHANGMGNGNADAFSYAQGSPTSLSGFGAVGAGSRRTGKERHVSRDSHRDRDAGAAMRVRMGIVPGRMDIDAFLAEIKVPSQLASPGLSPNRDASASAGFGLGGEKDGDVEGTGATVPDGRLRTVGRIGRPPY